jgi:lysophospholipase L1-like esterase
MKKLYYVAGVCLTLAGSLTFTRNIAAADEPAIPVSTNTAVIPAPHVGREKDVQRKLERFSGKHFDVIFDGDSIMNRWETTGREVWNHRYAGIAADFGIEGDRVENVLWRLDHGQVEGMNPRVVMLMIGTNNSGRNRADEIADGIKKLVADYEKRCPQAHIILMAIFPRGEKPDDGGRRKVAAVNALIKPLGDEPRVTFIDIGDQLKQPDGTILRTMMPDFVHPTAPGYQIWAEAIQPVIDRYVPSK